MTRVEDIWPDWHTEARLGNGAFGTVWRASRELLGHTSLAAVKIIEFPQDESEVTQLRDMGMGDDAVRDYLMDMARAVMREVATMDELKGAPHVVGVDDYKLVEREGGLAIGIRMELLEDLQAHFRRVGGPSQSEVARLGIDVCRALEACHARGIIHRDIKPQNVFVDEYGYLLGDFGIARQLERAGTVLSQRGTRSYMAPEIFFGAEATGSSGGTGAPTAQPATATIPQQVEVPVTPVPAPEPQPVEPTAKRPEAVAAPEGKPGAKGSKEFERPVEQRAKKQPLVLRALVSVAWKAAVAAVFGVVCRYAGRPGLVAFYGWTYDDTFYERWGDVWEDKFNDFGLQCGMVMSLPCSLASRSSDISSRANRVSERWPLPHRWRLFAFGFGLCLPCLATSSKPSTMESERRCRCCF